MKPIGILTFHRASNYGAVLQAYALQKKIRDEGADSLIVDYVCPAVEKDHRPIYLFKKNSPLKAIMLYPGKYRKDQVFNSFRKRGLGLSARVTRESVGETKGDYSIFVSGSDQVWNDRLSGLDTTYMMDFADQRQRYSYSCSFGFDEFPETSKELYLRHLSGINILSVRETSGADLLRSAGMDARVDVDPSLLLNADEWNKFAKKPDIKEPYILVYRVSVDVHLLEYARELSRKTGIQIIYLNNEHNRNRDIRHVRYATPEEFVGWFANAEYVLTNSFHGTVFSLLYNKKVKVELNTRNKFNVRSRDMLRKCGLEHAILDDRLRDFSFDYNWKHANEIIERSRDYSVEYVRQLISAAYNLKG